MGYISHVQDNLKENGFERGSADIDSREVAVYSQSDLSISGAQHAVVAIFDFDNPIEMSRMKGICEGVRETAADGAKNIGGVVGERPRGYTLFVFKNAPESAIEFVETEFDPFQKRTSTIYPVIYETSTSEFYHYDSFGLTKKMDKRLMKKEVEKWLTA